MRLAQGRQDRGFLDCVYSEIEAINEVNEFKQKVYCVKSLF